MYRRDLGQALPRVKSTEELLLFRIQEDPGEDVITETISFLSATRKFC
jgi:hypothetical protein